jgi:hypothetical protein
MLHKNRSEIAIALDSYVWLDARDWLIECGRVFSLSKAESVRLLGEVWLLSPSGGPSIDSFIGYMLAQFDEIH